MQSKITAKKTFFFNFQIGKDETVMAKLWGNEVSYTTGKLGALGGTSSPFTH